MNQTKTFDADAYKKQAWQQLKGRWGVPITMTLVSLGVCVAIFIVVCVYAIFNPLFALLFLFFGLWLTQSVLKLSQTYIYMGMARSSDKQHISFFGKKIKDTWALGIKSSVIRLFLLLLWTLLLIFPLFIKYYAYSQMTFILAEYPKMSITKVIKLSAIITKGHKKDLFFMDISFLGWFFLSLISSGIGFLWLIPYRTLSLTNVYNAIKHEAIVTKKIPDKLRAEME